MTPELKQLLEAYAQCKNLTTNYEITRVRVRRHGVEQPPPADAPGWDAHYTGETKNQSLIEYAGLKLPLSEWANRADITPTAMRNRLRTHPIGIALSMPKFASPNG
jgi:hypothetical protein